MKLKGFISGASKYRYYTEDAIQQITTIVDALKEYAEQSNFECVTHGDAHEKERAFQEIWVYCVDNKGDKARKALKETGFL